MKLYQLNLEYKKDSIDNTKNLIILAIFQECMIKALVFIKDLHQIIIHLNQDILIHTKNMIEENFINLKMIEDIEINKILNLLDMIREKFNNMFILNIIQENHIVITKRFLNKFKMDHNIEVLKK
jgi:hypothetical protein